MLKRLRLEGKVSFPVSDGGEAEEVSLNTNVFDFNDLDHVYDTEKVSKMVGHKIVEITGSRGISNAQAIDIKLVAELGQGSWSPSDGMPVDQFLHNLSKHLSLG